MVADIDRDVNVEFGVVDPRCEELGLRTYVSKANASSVFDPEVVQIADEDYYDALRYIHMIPQWAEVKDALPGKMNFDLLGSIDLKKGCFLGQELTARTHFTGIVRRRPFFFICHHPNVKIDPSEAAGYKYFETNATESKIGRVLRDSQGREVCTVMCTLRSPVNKFNYCLGMFDYLTCKEMTLVDDEGRLYTRLESPYLAPDIEEYVRDIERRRELNQQLADI